MHGATCTGADAAHCQGKTIARPGGARAGCCAACCAAGGPRSNSAPVTVCTWVDAGWERCCTCSVEPSPSRRQRRTQHTAAGVCYLHQICLEWTMHGSPDLGSRAKRHRRRRSAALGVHGPCCVCCIAQSSKALMPHSAIVESVDAGMRLSTSGKCNSDSLP